MIPSSARGAALRAVVLVGGLAALGAIALAGPRGVEPRYAADGQLRRPEGVERWVLVGTSLGQGYTDATEEGPGLFHRVYLEPGAYEHFRRAGSFREGTMLALVIRRPEQRIAPSRSGWTEGDLVALELAVKDPARYPGGWAYFDFGRSAAGALPFPPDRCAACHARHAARDNVFLQFYPELRGR